MPTPYLSAKCLPIACTLQVLALLELLLPKRATEQRVAVLIYPIGEVLTGYADAGPL